MNAKIAAAISLGASSLALIGSISIANAANAATTTTDTSNHPAARVESISDTGFNAVSNVVTIDPQSSTPQTVNSPVAGNESGKTQADQTQNAAAGQPQQDQTQGNPGAVADAASQAGGSQTSSDPSASAQGKTSEKKEDQGSEGSTVAQDNGKDSKTPPAEVQEKFATANQSMLEAQKIYNSANEEVKKGSRRS